MKKFIIQMVVLFIFIEILTTIFATEFAELSQSGWGEGLRIAMFLALGWYWGNIWDYVANKIKKARAES